MLIARTGRTRRGFSLIEILVGILLIGVLMAVAAPRLLGSREAAGDSAAQQQLNTVMIAAQTAFTSRESYANADATGLADDLKEIPLVGGAALFATGTNTRQVSVAASATQWTAAALGGNGNCWYLRLDVANGDQYGLEAGGNETTGCNAASIPGSIVWQSYGFPDTE